MPCKHCGAAKTIEAHLIPRAFVMEVKGSRGEQHLLVHRNRERPQVSNTGIYDKNLLCSACDGRLGGYEGYAVELLRRCRTQQVPPGKVVTVRDLDGDKMVRFAAGVAWKYAATTKANGRIDIGRYAEVLRDVALRGADIPDSIDVTMARVIELDGDVYYYRTPMPDRKEGVNVIRFCVGGFLFFLKIDKRLPGRMLPDACWLRGRSGGAFLTVPGEYVEEARMHAALASRTPVRRFFTSMRERADARSSS